MKFIVPILILFSANAFAYTIKCEKDVSGPKPFRLTIEESEFNPGMSWMNANVTNEYNQGASYSVFQTSRKNILIFYGLNGKEEFSLDLGNFKGEGAYSNAKLGINTTAWFGRKLDINCKILGEIPFINYCVTTKKWNPQDGLLQSARNRNLDLVEATLACGVDPNIKDKNQCTPVLLAADSNCGTGFPHQPSQVMSSVIPVLGALIDQGAYLDEIDGSTGESAFLKLVKSKDRDAAQFLLDLDAEKNLQDLEGYTALMRAVENYDYQTVYALISFGVDDTLKNKKKRTAYDIAKIWGDKKIIELLSPPQTIVTIEGKEDGSCSESEIHLPAKKVSRIILKATQNEMFMFEAQELSLELMANAGGQAMKNVLPKSTGEFEFTCGFHHGGTPTKGKIVVE